MRILLTPFVAAALIGCEGPAAPESVLEGQWATEDAEFVANRQGGILRLSCLTASVPDPLELNTAGTFSTAAIVSWQSWAGPTPVLRIQGRLEDSSLVLVVSYKWPDGYEASSSLTLAAGAQPTFSGACLA